MKRLSIIVTLGFGLSIALSAQAQTAPSASAAAQVQATPSDIATAMAQVVAPKKPVDTTPAAPEILPGKGLAQHDFLYAGEGRDRNIYIVKNGKVVWSYLDNQGRGEISDAMMLSNGNVLFAHQYGITLLSPDKKVIWNYDTPAGNETHTACAIGKNHVLFIQNGAPALLKVVDITTGATVKQFELPVGNPTNVHPQFRHASLTKEGTLLVAHMDLNKVSEYDSGGKEIWSTPAPGAWATQELNNGNILLTDNSGIREVNRKGETVWSFAKTDMPPGYRIRQIQKAWRLPNGNTVFNNWVTKSAADTTAGPAQAFEVTPDKKLVWALRSWSDPDLGPSTTIQILDQPVAPEKVHFGDIK